jgi:hypothetical protein
MASSVRFTVPVVDEFVATIEQRGDPNPQPVIVVQDLAGGAAAVLALTDPALELLAAKVPEIKQLVLEAIGGPTVAEQAAPAVQTAPEPTQAPAPVEAPAPAPVAEPAPAPQARIRWPWER